ncbi:hypothetical protein [Bacteroides caecigallinarum]|nr:hypothetical protein [Bacteroides caecigallinarum]MBM6884041.1 hypothetical protein [Bacteroides caecigallinarum]
MNTFYQMWGDGEGGGYLCASGGVRSSASRTLSGEENGNRHATLYGG